MLENKAKHIRDLKVGIEEIAECEIAFNKETSNTALIVGDGLNYAGYIINKNGAIVKSDEFGFSCGKPTINADLYLQVFEQFCDEDPHLGILKLARNE